jgi:hypothetical protein
MDNEDRDDFLRRLEEIVSQSKTRCCYWAVTELGMSLTELAGRRLGIAVSTVSGALQEVRTSRSAKSSDSPRS